MKTQITDVPNPSSAPLSPPSIRIGPPSVRIGPPSVRIGPPSVRFGPPSAQFGPPSVAPAKRKRVESIPYDISLERAKKGKVTRNSMVNTSDDESLEDWNPKPKKSNETKSKYHPSELVQYHGFDRCEACRRAGEEPCEFVIAQIGPTKRYYLNIIMGNPVSLRPSQHGCLRCTTKHLGTCLSPENRNLVGEKFDLDQRYIKGEPMLKSEFLKKYFGRNPDGSLREGFTLNLEKIMEEAVEKKKKKKKRGLDAAKVRSDEASKVGDISKKVLKDTKQVSKLVKDGMVVDHDKVPVKVIMDSLSKIQESLIILLANQARQEHAAEQRHIYLQSLVEKHKEFVEGSSSRPIMNFDEDEDGGEGEDEDEDD